MKHTRRTILGSGLALASSLSTESLSSPSIVVNHRHRVTDDELRSACAEHIRWRNNTAIGRRMSFADRDLSGLHFPDPNSPEMPNPEGLDFLCLNGSDFTNADLSFCSAGNIAFGRCHFQTAILSHSDFVSPGFSGATLWHAACRDVRWGHSDDKSSDQRAVIMDVSATRADFTQATIRGYFHRATFTAATMREADLSYCVFAGFGESETNRFWSTDFSFAKFRHSQFDDARFEKASLDQADFQSARLSMRAQAGLYRSHPHLYHLLLDLAGS
jgi:uncharacterized protein YjbI with pentapeptide repeats